MDTTENLRNLLESRRNDTPYRQFAGNLGIGFTDIYRFMTGQRGLALPKIRQLAAKARADEDTEMWYALMEYATGQKMDISRESIQFCRRMVAKYLDRMAELKDKARNCEPAQRGGYLSNAAQRGKDAERWQNNLEAQMWWLHRNNPDLYEELKAEE